MPKKETTISSDKHSVQLLDIDKIQIPDLRVTSQVDDHILAELRESIKEYGILEPLQVGDLNSTLVLIDGLHRLLVAKELGIKQVPCIVSPKTERDIMIHNLILNRQRGKSNPVQESEIIRCMIENEGLPVADVANLCGLSQSWVARLYEMSKLPKEVLALVESGALGISHATHLCKLQDPELQKQVAKDAVAWRYTEEQVKLRVQDLLQVRPEPGPGETTFEEAGRPVIIPITCHFCHAEVQRGDGYIWVCDEHRKLMEQFWQAYITGNQPVGDEVPTPQPQKIILSPAGWVKG
jgi:ParB family chromosome partitioning protein